MKISGELVESCRIFINPLLEREIDLRGKHISVIENLGVLKDQVDVIDFTDNEIERLENFPRFSRIKWILLSNNQVARIQPGLHEFIPNLQVLVLANNRVTLLSEIDKLAGFRNLQVLNLLDNPVRLQKHYRLYVIHKIPSLQVLDLDRVKTVERQQAAKLFGTGESSALGESSVIRGVVTTGNGGSSSSSSSSSSMGVAMTEEQKNILRQALLNAKTRDEVDNIEKMLRAGVVPDQETMDTLMKDHHHKTKLKESDKDVEMQDVQPQENDQIPMQIDTGKAQEDQEQAGKTKEPKRGRAEQTSVAMEEDNDHDQEEKPKQASPHQEQEQEETNTDWIYKLTVVQLKSELKKRKVKNIKGKKAQLQAELLKVVLSES